MKGNTHMNTRTYEFDAIMEALALLPKGGSALERMTVDDAFDAMNEIKKRSQERKEKAKGKEK